LQKKLGIQPNNIESQCVHPWQEGLGVRLGGRWGAKGSAERALCKQRRRGASEMKTERGQALSQPFDPSTSIHPILLCAQGVESMDHIQQGGLVHHPGKAAPGFIYLWCIRKTSSPGGYTPGNKYLKALVWFL